MGVLLLNKQYQHCTGDIYTLKKLTLVGNNKIIYAMYEDKKGIEQLLSVEEFKKQFKLINNKI